MEAWVGARNPAGLSIGRWEGGPGCGKGSRGKSEKRKWCIVGDNHF